MGLALYLSRVRSSDLLDATRVGRVFNKLERLINPMNDDVVQSRVI